MLVYSYDQFQNNPLEVINAMAEMLKKSPIHVLSEQEFQTIAKKEQKSLTSAAEVFGYTPASNLYLDEGIPRLEGLPRDVGE